MQERKRRSHERKVQVARMNLKADFREYRRQKAQSMIISLLLLVLGSLLWEIAAYIYEQGYAKALLERTVEDFNSGRAVTIFNVSTLVSSILLLAALIRVSFLYSNYRADKIHNLSHHAYECMTEATRQIYDSLHSATEEPILGQTLRFWWDYQPSLIVSCIINLIVGGASVVCFAVMMCMDITMAVSHGAVFRICLPMVAAMSFYSLTFLWSDDYAWTRFVASGKAENMLPDKSEPMQGVEKYQYADGIWEALETHGI